MISWWNNTTFNIDWDFIFGIYDAGTLYVFLIAVFLTLFVFVFRFAKTFRYYVEHGKYEHWYLDELMHRHPVTDIQATLICALLSVLVTFTWPVTVVYIVYYVAARFAHDSYKRKNKFITVLMGKESKW